MVRGLKGVDVVEEKKSIGVITKWKEHAVIRKVEALTQRINKSPRAFGLDGFGPISFNF